MNLHYISRKACKQHKCGLCGGFIEKGEEYVDIAYIFDEEVQSQKTHKHCQDVFNNICADYSDDGECDPYAILCEYASDNLSKEEHAKFENLSVPEQWKFMYDYEGKE